MAEEPHYRDSVKKLDIKISEIARTELRGKDTIKRDILCSILKIPKELNVRTKDRMIRETLIPACFKRKVSPNFLKHQLLCSYFQIPVYHRPKKDAFTKFKILEVLVKASPIPLASNEIAEILGESVGKVSAALCSYHYYQNPWFERITGKNGKKPYLWIATEEGLDAYNSDEARLLKRKQTNPILPGTSTRPRRCTVRASKVLEVLATAPFAPTSGSIVVTTGMKYVTVQNILKYDQVSKLPYFERIQICGEKRRYRWQASKAGLEFYYKQKRGM